MKRNFLIALIALVVIALIAVPSAYFFVFLPTVIQPIMTTQSTQETYPFVTEYHTQSRDTSPNAIAVDSSGSVWFMLENQSRLAQLFPSNQTIHEYLIPGAQRSIALVTWGMVIQSSKNLIWFTESVSNSVWSFNMETHQFVKYHIPTNYSFPFGIALDSSGNVWFTELLGNKFGEIVSGSTNVTEFNIPLSAPYGSEP